MFHVEHSEELLKVLAEAASEYGYVLDDRIRSELRMYVRELQGWSKKINLTAITKERDIAIKHFLDSLACSPILDLSTQRSLLDVGSGAGFPGLPLKIVHPQLDVVLLEPNLKKTAFLRHVIGTLHLKNTVVLSARIQDLAGEPDYQSHFDYVVTRAVRQEALLPFVEPLLTAPGQVILYRSRPLDLPVGQFGFTLLKECRYSLPRHYGTRVLTVLGHA
jgi:16S rRNA (guanine527-N7)-methyltransferase